MSYVVTRYGLKNRVKRSPKEFAFLRHSRVNDNLYAIILTAYKQQQRIWTYRDLSEETGVPYRTMVRYLKDPKYGLVEFGKTLGYRVVVRKHGRDGPRKSVIHVEKWWSPGSKDT